MDNIFRKHLENAHKLTINLFSNTSVAEILPENL